VIGGSVHEAMTDLVRLMGTLVDSAGKILVDGIMDDGVSQSGILGSPEICNRAVAPLNDTEMASYNKMDFDLAAYKADVGVNGISDKLLHETKADILMHRSLSIDGRGSPCLQLAIPDMFTPWD
jgi:hypothetical protein